MPRPTNKTDLLAAINREWQALEAVLAPLTPAQLVEVGIVGEWSVKDVLVHLSEWQQMVLGWYRTGLQGKMPQVPAPGYKWNQMPQLNQMIYEKYRPQPLADVMAHFHASHQETLNLLHTLSNEELFGAGRYAWTQKNTLGAYFVSATSSHYLWARNEIRKGLKRK